MFDHVVYNFVCVWSCVRHTPGKIIIIKKHGFQHHHRHQPPLGPPISPKKSTRWFHVRCMQYKFSVWKHKKSKCFSWPRLKQLVHAKYRDLTSTSENRDKVFAVNRLMQRYFVLFWEHLSTKQVLSEYMKSNLELDWLIQFTLQSIWLFKPPYLPNWWRT